MGLAISVRNALLGMQDRRLCDFAASGRTGRSCTPAITFAILTREQTVASHSSHTILVMTVRIAAAERHCGSRHAPQKSQMQFGRVMRLDRQRRCGISRQGESPLPVC